MFDNLRDSGDSFFYEEEQNDLYKEQPEPAVSGKQQQPVRAKAAPKAKTRRSGAQFLGLTAQQRFLLTLMLFFTVCIMGTLAMFVLGKMSIF